jgi:lycopene beta-cyclase
VKVGLALVGGGLANSLLAYRLRELRPELDLVVVERGPELGGNHTWSFHDSDLSPAQRGWMRPLVEHSWPRHELRFPNRRRVMESGYNTVSSDRLHRVVGSALEGRLRLGAEVVEISPTRVGLADGTRIEAAAVIDGRGDPGGRHLEVGFQKFVGRFVRLVEAHRLDAPILMDATVAQREGYRFVYTLPFAERELLIEDTYYSDGPQLERERIRSGITEYAERRGWRIAETIGEEEGVLPIVLGGDIEAFWAEGPAGVPRSGMRAALFHPTTGYSLPEAVRLADDIAGLPDLSSAALFAWTRRRSLELWRQHAFYRFLNRMLFRAAAPVRRYRIFERFYGLPDGLIHRFYAGRIGWIDKVRLLTGRPPVPLGLALRCLLERTTPPAGAAGGLSSDEEA